MKKGNFADQYARINDIDYMFVCKGFTIMMLCNGEQDVVDLPLFEIEKSLDRERFFRVHKSYIVNLGQVKRLQVGEDGLNVHVNGQKLPVSRRRKRALLKVMEKRTKR